MLKQLLMAGALTATPLIMADTAEAHCRPGHRSTVTVHRGPSYHHHHRGHVRSHRSYPAYRYGNIYQRSYRNSYRSPYRSYRYGYSPYRRGTSIGIGRGGVSLYFGF